MTNCEPRITYQESGGGVTRDGRLFEQVTKDGKPCFAVYTPHEYEVSKEALAEYMRAHFSNREVRKEDFAGFWHEEKVEYLEKLMAETSTPQMEVHLRPIGKCLWKTSGQPNFNLEGLHEDIRSFIYDHVELPDTRQYDLLSNWVQATWVPEIWEVVGYLFAHGLIETGKTKLLNVLAALSYRGIESSNMSEAVLFRACETWKPTIFLDEVDIYTTQKRQSIQNLLNSGYRCGLYAHRIKGYESGKPEIESFDVFGFKALAGTESMLRSLESRCIPIHMIQATRPLRFNIDRERAEEIRSRLLAYRFRTISVDAYALSAVSAVYMKGATEALSFASGRLVEILAATWAVNEQGRPAIESYAKDLVESRRSEEETSIEAQVCEAICRIKTRNLIKHNQFSTETVSNTFNEGRVEAETLNTLQIGRIIKRLGFQNKRFTEGGRSIHGFSYDENRLRYLAFRYNVPEEISGFTVETSLQYFDKSQKKEVNNSSPSAETAQTAETTQCSRCNRLIKDSEVRAIIDGFTYCESCKIQIIDEKLTQGHKEG